MKKHTIVDRQTGECLRDLFGDYRIVTKAQDDYLSNNIEINKGENFVKAWDKVVLTLYKRLNNAELLVFNVMSSNIQYFSGVCAFKNGEHLTKRHLSDMTEYSIRNIERILKTLTEKQTIAKVKTGHKITYLINPYIRMRGEKINRTLHELFKDSFWAKMFN